MKLQRPFSVPVDITQGFGPTDVQSEPAYAGFDHFHQGVDYAMPVGTDIVADGPGVARIGHDDEQGYGVHLIIDHGNGTRSLLGHLSTILVKDGEMVVTGQFVARSGNTGNSTGPHLHWGIITGYDYPIPPWVFVF